MTFKQKIYQIIFEAETRAGKTFDLVLIIFILASVTATMLESVQSIGQPYAAAFNFFELVFTAFFSVEYLMRIYASRSTKAYAFSFYGIVDLLATLPFYISLILPGAQSLSIVRGLRILRIFRVLKLNQYALAGQQLSSALKQSWPKIFVFLMTIVTAVTIMGALIHLVEGPENGFTSIPKGVYWAVVTMTTVGFGDLAPKTDLGQFMSVILMVLGYGVIAVPTGIVSSEIYKENKDEELTRTCPSCLVEGHLKQAVFCYKCGEHLFR